MRLIDANALMNSFREYMTERFDRDRCAHEENCKTCEGRCLWQTVVSAAPTVDAVYVVHGYWTKDDRCSECGADIPSDSWRDYIDKSECHYCYSCGAKMDGDENAK